MKESNFGNSNAKWTTTENSKVSQSEFDDVSVKRLNHIKLMFLNLI